MEVCELRCPETRACCGQSEETEIILFLSFVSQTIVITKVLFSFISFIYLCIYLYIYSVYYVTGRVMSCFTAAVPKVGGGPLEDMGGAAD